MSNKIKSIVLSSLFCIIVFGLFFASAFLQDEKYSESERRELASFPEVSVSTILSGDFMEKFESYTLDQFPLRDAFRTLKAKVSFSLFSQKDNNKLYMHDGFICKQLYPLNEESVSYAFSRMEYIYKTYLNKNTNNIYLSVIPDKSAFAAESANQLSLDYNKLYSLVKEKNTFAEYIDISSLLTLEDYYYTDTHWKQEKITDVAEKIATSMGAKAYEKYEKGLLTDNFYGVYYGQFALSANKDSIYCLTNEAIENCKVFDYQNNKEISVYNEEKVNDKDPYEAYLSGPLSLVEIENPNAESEKELVIFRDSFGSSIAPLLTRSYKKIILADIRYLPSTVMGKYIDFENKDILFLYSAMLLNDSSVMK